MSFRYRRTLLALITFLAVSSSNLPRTLAQEVNLMALGDWGIATPAHREVADAMGRYAATSPKPMNAVLSLGDNFYVPLHSPNDPAFESLFEKTFDAKTLNVPFYVLLGNHDYATFDQHMDYEWEMAYARTHPDSRWKLPAKWYRLDLPPEHSPDHPLVTILMLNSNKPGFSSQGAMPPADWDEEMTWLNRQLAGPRAAWTICCAHHTVYSNAGKGDNGVLITQWGALLEKYHVDMYLSGHEHSLQHLEFPGLFTSYVVSGGGGAKVDHMLYDNRGPYSKATPGFAALSIEPDQMTVRLLSSEGAVLHQFIRTKDGQITITKTTPSDPRSQHPLMVIQGIDGSQTTRPSTQPAN